MSLLIAAQNTQKGLTIVCGSVAATVLTYPYEPYMNAAYESVSSARYNGGTHSETLIHSWQHPKLTICLNGGLL